MTGEKTTAKKVIESTRIAQDLMRQNYARARQAQLEGKPVIWAAAVNEQGGAIVLNSLCEALDMVAVYPENFAALCAAKGAAIPFIDDALGYGYSNTICGYAKTNVGYSCKMMELGNIPPGSPGGGMAKPALLMPNSSLCDTRNNWFAAKQQYVDVPFLCWDHLSPLVSDLDLEEFGKDYVRYLAEDTRECVAWLEKFTGKKFDLDRFESAIDIGLETSRLWYECHELRKTIPCPAASGDMWTCMLPGYYLAGRDDALEFYKKLYAELKDRVDKGIGVVAEEKYRLMWCGLPPYHNLAIFDYMQNLGAVCCVESYEYFPAAPPYIPSETTDPFERLAWWTMWWFGWSIPQAKKESGVWRTQIYLEWARGYKLDGALLHLCVSCYTPHITQKHTKDMLIQYCQVPSLFVEGDIIDQRTFNEAQFKQEFAAFLEVMDRYREVRQEGKKV